jgi:hypothetical protein
MHIFHHGLLHFFPPKQETFRFSQDFVKKKIIHIDLKIVKTLRSKIMWIECVHESSSMLNNLVIS